MPTLVHWLEETNLCWFIGMLLLGACAPFVYDQGAVRVSVILAFYHRLLSHRGFKVPKLVEYFFVYCGAHALQCEELPNVSDLKAQAFYQFLHETYFWNPTALATLLYFYGGFPYLAWGMTWTRMVASGLHMGVDQASQARWARDRCEVTHRAIVVSKKTRDSSPKHNSVIVLPFLLQSLTMVLEATMICIDNSEWMRNGDYSPTRFQAQADAVNLICGAKTQSNPENTVGVLTMAGKGVRVLVTPTSDLGKILACMHGLEIGGEMNLAAGIQVAQLALKHRQNKKQQQRIIVFAGGPVKYDKKVLEMIGKKLKKNSVALDVVNFGEEDEAKTEKLEALVAAVNNNDSSHIVHVPAGSNALSDVLLSTPIFTGDGEGGSGFAAAAAAAAGGVSGFDFGVDPNLDPELALALRVSMEEERARQEAAAKKAADDSSKQEKGESTSQDATMSENAAASASESENKKDDLMDDENALLQQALAMSMDDPTTTVTTRDTDMSEAAADDQDLALALQLSVQEGAKDHQSGETDMGKLLADQSFVSSVLASLPGVDPNDPSVKDLLASMQSQPEKKDEDKAPKEEGNFAAFGGDFLDEVYNGIDCNVLKECTKCYFYHGFVLTYLVLVYEIKDTLMLLYLDNQFLLLDLFFVFLMTSATTPPEHHCPETIITLLCPIPPTTTITPRNPTSATMPLQHHHLDIKKLEIRQMDSLKSDRRMDGWLYLIRSNRFGLQYSRKRYFILEENCLKSFKSKPVSDSEDPLRSATVDSCIRVTDNGRESYSRKVFFMFTLYNTSDHNDCLKLGASNPEEAARWIHSLKDVAMEPGSNSKRRWQPFRLNDSKSAATRKRSLDWTSSASMHVDAMTSDTSNDYPAIMAVGVIEGACEAVFRTFMSLGLSRSEWDFCFYNGSVVEHLDGHTDIIHIQLCRDWLPWGMSRRDLLLRRYWRREDDGTYVILYHSVIHSKCQPQQGYVRAWLQSGGVVVSPLNQGKECVVKQMLSIDWKLWSSYLPKTSARSMTIRMLGRVSALKELFRAKGGDQFPSEFLTGEVESIQTSEEQIKQEGDLMEQEDGAMEDANDASVSCSSSLVGLNDASDEFHDVPEPSEDKRDMNSQEEQQISPNLSKAASFVKKLHGLASQRTSVTHCYGSTLLKDSTFSTPCSWAASDPSLFLVRGRNYLNDNEKNKAKGTMMEMVGADWLQSDKREDDLAGRSGGIVQKYAAKGGPEFFFVINIQVPGTTAYNLVLYYMTRTPLEESLLLERFVNGDDAFRNSRFKLIPYISKGSWLVKQSVGKKACLVGQALEVNYCRGKNYLELDVDVGSSTVARGVVNLVLGYLNNLIVEMAFLIQANTQDELPESLLGTCRLNHMDTAKSVSVDSINNI
ncbi:hypothetical protein L1987_62185 [Smallanthus sonchifolius]|uniref:Uncharacterized protein n=1 Tax=Smallanthus sonchifolius TaxID=185202 RepID=A0ACB9C9Q8_9ASTR|nr:hypothetical protein L1987_62185 [Smallanthus sonchifolius]